MLLLSHMFLLFAGWRKSMEDSHIARFNLVPDVNVFGVFDGHGGN